MSVDQDGINPADDPFQTGMTARGTIRVLIAAELVVDDEIGLLADSPAIELLGDEMAPDVLTTEAALTMRLGVQLAKVWPEGSRPVGMIHVFCGPQSGGFRVAGLAE